MKILIIGGTGLISTEISNQLLAQGADLTLFNRGETRSRLAGEAKTLQGDRKDHTSFEAAVRGSGPWDCIIDIHCSDPSDAESMNRAAQGKAEQLIFCSTSNVYPKPASCYPVKENEPPGAGYKNGIDKAGCERIHLAAHARGDYNATILRPGHTYGDIGPILHTLGSSTSFLDRLLKGKPVCIHGDGYGLWSAGHASDVARAFVSACTNERSYGEIYNVTGEEWFTWRRYYEVIAAALKGPSPQFIPIPTQDLFRINPRRSAQCERSFQYPGIYDNSRAREELNYHCEISLEEGLARNLASLTGENKIVSWESDSEYGEILAAFHADSR